MGKLDSSNDPACRAGAPCAGAAAQGAGEGAGNAAFCAALWLLGERFGAVDAAGSASAATDAADGRLRSDALANRFDAALGPCFADGGGPVSLAACYAGQKPSSARPANHSWEAYRRGRLDEYFALLRRNLPQDLQERLVEALGGRVDARAGFNGAEGFSFHGIKDEAIVQGAGMGGAPANLRADFLLSGIGPNGELLLRFRRVGDMGFGTESSYGGLWPFRWSGPASRPHPSEYHLWKSKMKESYFDADLKVRAGAAGQEVRRTQPERLADYLVCAPYVAACELSCGEGGARRLTACFLEARCDSAQALFGEKERRALAALPWPADPFEAAAVIAAALVRFALGGQGLGAALRALLGAQLSAEAAYLGQLADWALEIAERDGASGKVERLQDVYVAPPFSGDDAVAWLLSDEEEGRMLLEAGSGMGKSTLLHALAAACAGVRAARLRAALAEDGEDEGPRASESGGFALARALAPGGSEGAQGASEALDAFASFTPVLLSQTRDEGLYRRLLGIDGNEPLPFEEFAFSALSPLAQGVMRAAAQREGAAAWGSVPERAGAEGGLASEPAGAACENPLMALLSGGRVLLMVDSIDEIPRRYRASYLKRLEGFLSRCGVARLLVASRPLPFDDAEALRGLLGRRFAQARLAPFDLPRQERLFRKAVSRSGGDAYEGPSFSAVRATPGFAEIMGNPFMLTAVARELKRRHRGAARCPYQLFAEINNRFRKRVTLEPYDEAALKRLAFDLTVGKPELPVVEFVEKFRRYRNEEASFQAGGAVALEMDEDDVVDLIMSRLGIVDARDDAAGFPFAAVKGFWASLWVRGCVERAQGSPKSALDIEGCGEGEQQACFKRGAQAGWKLGSRLLRASSEALRGEALAADAPGADDASAEGVADDAPAGNVAEDAALLALMFTLDYAASRNHADYPAFDLLLDEAYRALLTQCLLGDDAEERTAVAALRTAARFQFGAPLPGYEDATAAFRRRLAVFAGEGGREGRQA